VWTLDDCRYCCHVANGSKKNKVLRVSYTAPGEWWLDLFLPRDAMIIMNDSAAISCRRRMTVRVCMCARLSVYVGSRAPLSSKRPLLSLCVSVCLSVCLSVVVRCPRPFIHFRLTDLDETCVFCSWLRSFCEHFLLIYWLLNGMKVPPTDSDTAAMIQMEDIKFAFKFLIVWTGYCKQLHI